MRKICILLLLPAFFACKKSEMETKPTTCFSYSKDASMMKINDIQ
jgi:hypothetical protein